jgi:hypothetical protein
MFGPMTRRLLAGVGLIVLAFSLGTLMSQETKPSPQKPPPLQSPPPPQEYPAEKPKYDYMSTFFSRNTKPLGLKEDLAVKSLLRQPSIKWAVRTGQRNVLN